MYSSDGIEVGWLLGHPIDEREQFIGDTVRMPFDSRASSSQFEAWLYRHVGRFLAIWLTPLFERVYLDAGGLVPVVYSQAHDLVCSTTSLVPYSHDCDDNLALLLQPAKSGLRSALCFGLTARYGVERVHPNHYLDLSQWTARRHWPHAPLNNGCDPDEAVDTVTRLVRRHIAAATRRGSIMMALTAGSDSRSILACSREFLPQIETMTIAIPDNTGRLDVEVATKLARRHGLRHRVIPHRSPTDEDLQQWLWRTGSTISEPRAARDTLAYSQIAGAIEVTGAGGEAARVAYWRDTGHGKKRITPELLADCLELPPSASVLSRVRAWMESYPGTTPVQIIDGFFIEQALGTFTGTLAYGDAGFVGCRVHPFVSREAFTAMLSLPERYKIQRRFPVDLMHRHWPELLRTPINRRSGARHYVARIRRRAWLWRRALAGNRRSR